MLIKIVVSCYSIEEIIYKFLSNSQKIYIFRYIYYTVNVPHPNYLTNFEKYINQNKFYSAGMEDGKLHVMEGDGLVAVVSIDEMVQMEITGNGEQKFLFGVHVREFMTNNYSAVDIEILDLDLEKYKKKEDDAA